ncbi:MAG: S8 family serine peptidase [Bdellovibrionia bacterium]
MQKCFVGMGKTSSRFFVLFASLFILSACNKDLVGIAASRAAKGDVCTQSKALVSEMQTPFERQGSKVLTRRGRGISIQNTGAEFKRGEKLVAVVDVGCEAGGGNAERLLRSRALVLENDTSTQELSAWAESDPCVIGISESTVFHTSYVPNDTQYGQLTHMTAIKANLAYDTFYSATNGVTTDVVIAVIDTGVDLTHPDLMANRWVNPRPGTWVSPDGNTRVTGDTNGYNFASGIGASGPQVWTDDPGGEVHGTHVGGLAAAVADNSTGVAGVMGKHAKIMSLNIFGTTSGAAVEDLDNAIYYAADNGAKVINMSLGACTDSPSTETAIAYALNKGSIIVTAAGNDGQELTDDPNTAVQCGTAGRVFITPGSYARNRPGLITVASTNAVNAARSSFSNFSTTLVKIAAPGSDSSSQTDNATGSPGLRSTLPGNQYGLLQGTSMASPVAAGALALAIGLAKSRFNIDLTPGQIETILTDSAKVETILNTAVKGGKSLDLNSLAAKILENDFPPASTCP